MFKITQNYRKITLTFTILTIYGIIYLSSSISSVDAAPRDIRYDSSKDCKQDISKDEKTCCWREPVPGKILPETYCQTCDTDGNNCGDKELQMDLVKTPETARPPTNDEPVLENPETEQQPDPGSPPTNQRVPPVNVGILEQLEDSSNNEQSQESDEPTDTNNADTAYNSQEIDELSNSETTNSLSKRGNTQNSPVPPECPKQGPIPPDCTMKPKF